MNKNKIATAIREKVIYVWREGVTLQQLILLKKNGFTVIFK